MSEKAYDDLLKRVEKMSLAECKRMAANLPPNLGSVDETIMGMLRDRIEQLRQQGAEECE